MFLEETETLETKKFSDCSGFGNGREGGTGRVQ